MLLILNFWLLTRYSVYIQRELDGLRTRSIRVAACGFQSLVFEAFAIQVSLSLDFSVFFSLHKAVSI
jgi:hypothetical protein